MHQQTTQTKRFEKLLNWCEGAGERNRVYLRRRLSERRRKIAALEELLDKSLTMQSPLIVLSNKIKTAITQLKDK